MHHVCASLDCGGEELSVNGRHADGHVCDALGELDELGAASNVHMGRTCGEQCRCGERSAGLLSGQVDV